MKTLRRTMLINAISSAATGGLLALSAQPIATLFAATLTYPFIEVGIFLLVFAAFVFAVAVKQQINIKVVKLIIIMDSIWVVMSFAAILFLAKHISVIGLVSIAAVALWVAMMAYLQNKGVKQMV